jgi:hypothetical protein
MIRAFLAVTIALFALLGPRAARAGDRYVLIVSGAAGEQDYQAQYAAWRDAVVQALVKRDAVEPSHVNVLFDGADPAHAATAANVRAAVGRLRTVVGPDDILFLMLIGHGTFDGLDAKFNLVGPDLTAAEWAAMLQPIAGRLVVVNSAAASFPFLERLSGPRRIVITATDSGAQRFDTVFPEFFARALADDGADLDKNGRISIWEAFLSASMGVRRYYEQRGQLATERPLLDDTGDGHGREAGADGDDGSQASRLYFDPQTADATPTDQELLDLLQKRSSLEADAEDLQARRPLMTADEYAREFEQLMIELAKTSREIRRRKKT